MKTFGSPIRPVVQSVRHGIAVAGALLMILMGVASMSATDDQTHTVNNSVLNSLMFNSPIVRIVTDIAVPDIVAVPVPDIVTVPSAFADGDECEGVNPPPNIDCPDPTPTPTATPTPDPEH